MSEIIAEEIYEALYRTIPKKMIGVIPQENRNLLKDFQKKIAEGTIFKEIFKVNPRENV